MRVVLQRVLRAEVRSEGELLGRIGAGLLLLVGFAPEDGREQMEWMARRISSLKLWEDGSVMDGKRSVLSVSQFTLFADVRKGVRPSWSGAAPSQVASSLYAEWLELLRGLMPGRVEDGRFGADMQVESVNDGPLTLFLEKSKLPYCERTGAGE